MSNRLSREEKVLTAIAVQQHIQRLVGRGMPYRKAVLATLVEIRRTLLSQNVLGRSAT